MNEEASFVVCEDVEVPESGLLRRECSSRYGSVPGLDDAELADPDELEREVMLEEWGPVLALPVKGNRSNVRPVVDEAGGVDWVLSVQLISAGRCLSLTRFGTRRISCGSS